MFESVDRRRRRQTTTTENLQLSSAAFGSGERLRKEHFYKSFVELSAITWK